MQSNQSTLTPKSSSADLLSSALQKRSQSLQKVNSQSSMLNSTLQRNQYLANQRRQNLSAITNDNLIDRASTSCTAPVLIATMNSFFQKAQTMEEEVMLPSRLKDMSVEQLPFDNAVQQDSWHDIYSFVRQTRNQLQCMYPFADDQKDIHNSKEHVGKDYNEDEGIILSNLENNQSSEVSSIASADEYEQSLSSSGVTSCDTIKDELKYHYYGLFRALDNLSTMAQRVTEKYREEYVN